MRALKLGTAATVAAAGSILALGGPAAAAGSPDEQAPCLAHVFQSQAVSAPQTVSNRILEIRDLYLQGAPFGQVLKPLAQGPCEG